MCDTLTKAAEAISGQRTWAGLTRVSTEAHAEKTPEERHSPSSVPTGNLEEANVVATINADLAQAMPLMTGELCPDLYLSSDVSEVLCWFIRCPSKTR